MKPTFSYAVAPHLEEFNIPFADFKASNPELTHFVGGGLVFSRQAPMTSGSGGDTKQPPTRVLLLQRALEDSFGGLWEGPGGSCDPDDNTLLEGVAREVFEETGLHVSRFVDLVSTHKWVSLKPDRVNHVAKFTFVVEVHEARTENWENSIILDPKEHRAFHWATEDEVQEIEERKADEFKFFGEQGKTMLTAFRLLEKESSS